MVRRLWDFRLPRDPKIFPHIPEIPYEKNPVGNLAALLGTLEQHPTFWESPCAGILIPQEIRYRVRLSGTISRSSILAVPGFLVAPVQI